MESSDEAIRSICSLSSMGFWWVQNMHLNKPAKDSSRDPSSLSSLDMLFCKNPKSDFDFVFRLFSSSNFFSSSSSYEQVAITINNIMKYCGRVPYQ